MKTKQVDPKPTQQYKTNTIPFILADITHKPYIYCSPQTQELDTSLHLLWQSISTIHQKKISVAVEFLSLEDLSVPDSE